MFPHQIPASNSSFSCTCHMLWILTAKPNQTAVEKRICRELLACQSDLLASDSTSVICDGVCWTTIEVHIRITHPKFYSVHLKVTTIVFLVNAFSHLQNITMILVSWVV
jgi:hypothetical protein